jgi:menaquinone-specific isochorismate synthase
LRREGEFLASLTAPAGAVSPDALLRATERLGIVGRGFWQDGGRWLAHAGAVFEIDSRAPGAATNRFAAVREEAAAIGRLPWLRAGEAVGYGPRFHGGFAFRADHPPAWADGEEAGFWESFPAARFVLPHIEVEAGDGGTVITLTERFPATTSEDEAVARLEGRLEEINLELADPFPELGPPPSSALPSAAGIEEPLDAGAWRSGIGRILADIERREVQKVVLARPLDVSLSEIPDPISILHRLRAANPLSHAFLMQFEADHFLLGAAPELLGSLVGGAFRTMAVAGSIPRGSDPESDEWLGRQLLSSRKNLAEHQIVVDDIVERLLRFIPEPRRASEPALLKLSGIQHLRVTLEGEVPAGTHILELIEALHPTAAVCGYPRETALEILTEEERVGRGWYAGPVGWFDAHGEGEFAPALRSAVACGPLLRLYAGAGIVDGSRAGAEWDETRVKLQTVLRALGIARVP